MTASTDYLELKEPDEEDLQAYNQEMFLQRVRDRRKNGSTVVIRRIENYAYFDPPFFGSSPGHFGDFKEAIDGARYIPRFNGNLAPLDKVGQILIKLRDAGFGTRIADDLKQILEVKTATQKFDLDGARDRIAKIDRELRERHPDKYMFMYQKTGAQWITMRQSALLADQQGTGKTLQIIAALPADVPTLIVCPAVAKGVWKYEVNQWRPGITVEILQGRESFRWPRSKEMVVINYHILPDIHDRTRCDGFGKPIKCLGCRLVPVWRNKDVTTVVDGHEPWCEGIKVDPKTKKPIRIPCKGCAEFLNAMPPGTTIVADEAQALKDAKTAQHQKFRALSHSTLEHGGRVWLASGTPLENTPKELWNVLDAADLATQAFGDYNQYRKIWRATPKSYGGFDWGLPTDDIRERLRRVSLRRLRSEVMPELPTKIWQFIPVDIDKKTLAECEGFLKQYGGMAKLLATIGKGLPEFKEMSTVRSALAKAKIKPMLDIVEEHEENDEPLLVFSCHRAPIDVLKKRPGWMVITGDEDAEEKTRVARYFQDGDPECSTCKPHLAGGPCKKHKLKGIGLTIRAGGTAITLHRAHIAVYVDLDWSPSKNEQSEDRICRIGQDRGIIIKILQANHPLDERVIQILHRKRAMIDASVNASAVKHDAVADKDFEDAIERVRAELKLGDAATRTKAVNDNHKLLVELLHREGVVYPRKGDGQLAVELAEQARMIGLTVSQWELASQLTSRAIEREVLLEDSNEELDNEDEDSVEAIEEVEAASEQKPKPSRKPKQGREKMKASKTSEQKKRAKAERKEARVKVAPILETIDTLSMLERDVLFDQLEKTYCAECGEKAPNHDKNCDTLYCEDCEELLPKHDEECPSLFCEECDKKLPRHERGCPVAEEGDDGEPDDGEDEDEEDDDEEDDD